MSTRARSCSMRFALGRTPNSKVQNDRVAAFPHDDRTVPRAITDAVQMKLCSSSTAIRNLQPNATYAAKLARAEGRKPASRSCSRNRNRLAGPARYGQAESRAIRSCLKHAHERQHRYHLT